MSSSLEWFPKGRSIFAASHLCGLCTLGTEPEAPDPQPEPWVQDAMLAPERAALNSKP